MKKKLIIFTDLDGSLLDHFTYSFEPAVPLLKHLDRLHIPVVFTTSKTFSEVEVLREKTGNLHPFIVENGAGVYIPEKYFKTSIQDIKLQDNYIVRSFVAPHKHWAHLLELVGDRFRKYFKPLTKFTDKELVQLTGLSLEEARRAQQRKFGEPVWWFGSDTLKKDFTKELENLGANTLQGGRFIHVSGECNKGRALNWLLDQYSIQSKEKCVSLAAGDSYNDVAMLEAADLALIIRSPVHPPPVLQKTSNVLMSTLCGPEGWARGINQVLSDFTIEPANHP